MNSVGCKYPSLVSHEIFTAVCLCASFRLCRIRCLLLADSRHLQELHFFSQEFRLDHLLQRFYLFLQSLGTQLCSSLVRWTLAYCILWQRITKRGAIHMNLSAIMKHSSTENYAHVCKQELTQNTCIKQTSFMIFSSSHEGAPVGVYNLKCIFFLICTMILSKSCDFPLKKQIWLTFLHLEQLTPRSIETRIQELRSVISAQQ